MSPSFTHAHRDSRGRGVAAELAPAAGDVVRRLVRVPASRSAAGGGLSVDQLAPGTSPGCRC